MKIYLNIIYLFLGWALLIYFLMFFGFNYFPKNKPVSFDYFLPNLANWDGSYYLSIARFGYDRADKYAFFPLYPILIRVGSIFSGNYLISAVLISFFASLSGILILYKLLSEEFNKKTALKTISILLFFPTSFFLLVAYTEGLFFLLVVLTFFFFKKDKILFATITASLATGTRVSGIALAASLVLTIILQGKFRKNSFVLFSFSGLIIYCIYQYFQTSNPFYFLSSQIYWQRSIVFAGSSFLNALDSFSTSSGGQNILTLINILFAVFGLGLAIRAFRFLPFMYASYAFFSMLLPLSTTSLMSIPRFLLPVFPFFILIALIKNESTPILPVGVSSLDRTSSDVGKPATLQSGFSRDKNISLVYSIVSSILLYFFAMMYIRGYFIS